VTSDPSRVRAAAEDAGALSFLEKLPKGLETPLTRLFDDGQELSIGQWQRLALSRAFYPATRYLILDEPTSSVDPKTEFDFFDRFRERLCGRGALVISHRLSTVRQADYTYVLREGMIVEQGSHEALIAAGGVYAGLFARQASYFN
jgi:ATP-binding cassette subfamily B protein